MLLTLTTTYSPATDLGYLLHKNPARAQIFTLTFGQAHVFYPEISEERCTVALLVEVDPIALARKRHGPSGEGGQLDQYVNDRPYVASSFLSVALGEVFGSALAGRSKDRPDWVKLALPLEVHLPVVPCRGGKAGLEALFGPLGYDIAASRLPLDETVPEWGESPYFSVTLRVQRRLQEVLSHLYVLLPVLDNDKHYWVGDDEVDKLLRHGHDWLTDHPERELIARRYLKHQKSLARQALARLIPEEAAGSDELMPPSLVMTGEAALETQLRLNDQRIQAVVDQIRDLGARSVIDLGCGEGKLLSALLKDPSLERLVGLDVSVRALEIATERLNLDRLPPALRNKINLWHGALTYRDHRFQDFDVATVIEVVEHLDTARLSAFERVLFECANPRAIILTTPNAEYNVRFEHLPIGQYRHPDHRFEWTRAEFRNWADRVAARHGFTVRFASVGENDPILGPPTQMAIFQRS
jgi:3' terminal RNA ribose 2'-O-methyltransferase Hen1